MLSAYILVRRGRFSYSDVKSMTRLERATFLKILKDDIERNKNGIEFD